jgi:hypothetical protein
MSEDSRVRSARITANPDGSFTIDFPDLKPGERLTLHVGQFRNCWVERSADPPPYMSDLLGNGDLQRFRVKG